MLVVLVRPTTTGSESETGFVNTFRGLLKQMSLAVSMSYWSFFKRNLVGLAHFAGSKFQTDGQLAQFRFLYRNWVNCPKQTFQRMANWPSFDFFYRNWVNCTKQDNMRTPDKAAQQRDVLLSRGLDDKTLVDFELGGFMSWSQTGEIIW